MFSLDDRAGNAVTTVALFRVAATILYLARGIFLILLLSLLFAYLLDPLITLVQQHSRLGRHNRTCAIAQVYLSGEAGRIPAASTTDAPVPALLRISTNPCPILHPGLPLAAGLTRLLPGL